AGVLDHARWSAELLPDRPQRGIQQRHRGTPGASERDDHSERALHRLAILAGDGDDAAGALFDRLDRGGHPAFTHPAPALAEARRSAGNDVTSLEAIIRELGRAAARARGARYAVHALVAALAWIAVVLVIARLTPFEGRALVAAVGIPIVLVIALLAWLIRRPTATVLMRLADFRLGLKERLSTAWERRSESGPMDAIQLRDALSQAAGTRLARAFPVRVSRGEASVVAVLAIFSLALALLPNPMDQVLAQRQADRLSQARAAKAVQAAQKKIADSPKPTPVDPQVQKLLQDAAAKIREADSPRKALDSLTPASAALKSGETSAAAQSLNGVASQLDSLQQQENTDQAVASAINGLEAARQELAAQADRDATGQGAQANAGASASPGASPGA